MSKYEILKDDHKEVIDSNGRRTTVYRIRALVNFKVTKLDRGGKKLITERIRRGDLGGYVESEWNVSQHPLDHSWPDGVVMGDARLDKNSYVGRRAVVDGHASIKHSIIMGESRITDFVEIYNSTIVSSELKDGVKISNSSLDGAKLDGNLEMQNNCLNANFL